MTNRTIQNVSKNVIETLKEKYGSPLYIYDEASFVENYNNLRQAFVKYYPKYNIAYSYKTNYMPYICSIVRSLGGLAEVVSDFEYYVAKIVGNNNQDIVYNGPCKQALLEEHLLNKGIVNIDNYEECIRIINIAKNYPEKTFEVGIRVNIDIGQSFVSRFGMDPKSRDFEFTMEAIQRQSNIGLVGLHCHIGQSRTINNWIRRADRMLELADWLFPHKPPKYIDLGSGMFGDMEPEFKQQFDCEIPEYDEYAREVAGRLWEHYKMVNPDDRPWLYTEPGATSASRYMWLISTVISHKNVQGIEVTGLDCSFFNAGETSKYKKLPIKAFDKLGSFVGGNLVGYTCLEDDVIYRDFKGMLSIGDTVVFGNTGGYSLVFKPPFILPDIPVIALKADETTKIIKKRQTFDDMLTNYVL